MSLLTFDLVDVEPRKHYCHGCCQLIGSRAVQEVNHRGEFYCGTQCCVRTIDRAVELAKTVAVLYPEEKK